MTKLRQYFISGLIAILPITVSFWILALVFNFLDSILGKPITKLIGFRLPGLGLVLIVVFLLLVGIFARNVIFSHISQAVDRLIARTPLLRDIYVPIKDIIKNIANNQSSNFKQAVLIEYPRKGLYSVGFIIKENVRIDDVRKEVIFIPTTPNPTSGFMVYASADDYKRLDMSVDTALKTVISLGAISPDQLKFKE